MNVNWYKSETREVRPFFEVESVEEALRDAEVRLFDEAPFLGTESYLLNEQELRRLSPVVRPRLDVSRIKGNRTVNARDLVLVVSATNPFLKRTRLIGQHNVAGKLPEEIAVGAEVLDALGGGANLEMDVTLCLNRGLPRQAGKPFIPGHWIARKQFSVRSAKQSEDFDVETLDDEGWKARGFPAKTLYNVEYMGEIASVVEANRPIAKVQIHVDVYRRIAAESDSKLARPVQTILAAEIIAQVLAASASEWEGLDEPERGSPLSAVLKHVNKVERCSLRQLHALATGSSLQRLRALLHADRGTVRAIAEA